MPGQRRVDRAGHDAADARHAASALSLIGDDAGRGADHVDDVARGGRRRRSHPSARRTRRPGSGMPGAQPESLVAHSASDGPASVSEVAIAARRSSPARRRAADRPPSENASGGRPPSAAFHSHLWPIAQTLRGTCAGSVDAAQHGRDHVAVLERRHEPVALVRVVAQPVQQLRESPLRRVHAAAPVDGLESASRARRAVMSAASSPGAVVAPEVVVVERHETLAHRARRSTRWCRARSPRSRCPSTPAASSRRAAIASTSASMWSCVALGGVVGVARLRCSGYSAVPTRAARCGIDDRHAHAQRAEIHAGDDAIWCLARCRLIRDRRLPPA